MQVLELKLMKTSLACFFFVILLVEGAFAYIPLLGFPPQPPLIIIKEGDVNGDINGMDINVNNVWITGDLNFVNGAFVGNLFGGTYYGDGSNLTGVSASADINGQDISPQSVDVDANLSVRGDANFASIGFTKFIWGDGSKLTGVSAVADVNGQDISPQSVDIDANLSVGGDSNFVNIGVSQDSFIDDLFGTGDINFVSSYGFLWEANRGNFAAGDELHLGPNAYFAAMFGQKNQMFGESSAVFGLENIVRGNQAIVISGQGNQANNNWDIAGGWESIADGGGAVAFGYKTNSLGLGSFAIGASGGAGSHIFATGEGSVAMGFSDTNTVASGKGSIALGYNVQALGDGGVSLGKNVVCEKEGQVCVYDLNVANDLNIGGDLNVGGSVILGSDSNFVNIGVSGQSFFGDFVNLHANPTKRLHPATKDYVDKAVAGADFDLFLFEAASTDVVGYQQLRKSASEQPEESDTETVNTDNFLIQAFVTEQSDINIGALSEGVYQLHVHASAVTVGKQDVKLFWRFFGRDPDGTEVQIGGDSEESIVLTSAKTDYDIHLGLESETDVDGNRFVVKVFANLDGVGGDPDTTIFYEGMTFSRAEFKTVDLSQTSHDLLLNREWADANHTFIQTGEAMDIGLYDFNVGGDSNFASLEANDAYLTNLTATGTITSGDITIFDATPILIFKDSDSLGAASVGFIEWRDSGGGRAGFLGNNTSGDDGFLWKNEVGGHIGIQTTGGGEFKVFADLNVLGDANFSKGVQIVGDLNVLGNLNAVDTNFANLGISQNAWIDGTTSTSELLIPMTASTWKIGEDLVANFLAIENDTSGKHHLVRMFAKDGDETDHVLWEFFGKGTRDSLAGGWHLVLIGWNTTSGRYEVGTLASGATEPLAIYTGANTSQLLLNVDGTVSIGGGELQVPDNDTRIKEIGTNVIEVHGNSGGILTSGDDATTLSWGNDAGIISLFGIPTSDPSVAGRLWNDTGFIRISSG